MSWLLFLDESGHDHRTTPYEVRGGIALHAKEVWPFVQDMQRLELTAFGTPLQQFRKELKGCKLVDKDRCKWAAQAPPMSEEARRKHCRAFLTKGLENKAPSKAEFTAYGQACLEMATGIFELLRDHDAKLFATVIPCSTKKPATYEATEFLRKDHVFLFERYFYFLEREQQHGLLVMDEVEKVEDRRFVRRLEAYFQKTQTGRYRSATSTCDKKSPTRLDRGLLNCSTPDKAKRTGPSTISSVSFMCRIRTQEDKKGGNAVRATRKQLLGRASTITMIDITFRCQVASRPRLQNPRHRKCSTPHNPDSNSSLPLR